MQQHYVADVSPVLRLPSSEYNCGRSVRGDVLGPKLRASRLPIELAFKSPDTLGIHASQRAVMLCCGLVFDARHLRFLEKRRGALEVGGVTGSKQEIESHFKLLTAGVR